MQEKLRNERIGGNTLSLRRCHGVVPFAICNDMSWPNLLFVSCFVVVGGIADILEKTAKCMIVVSVRLVLSYAPLSRQVSLEGVEPSK